MDSDLWEEAVRQALAPDVPEVSPVRVLEDSEDHAPEDSEARVREDSEVHVPVEYVRP